MKSMKSMKRKSETQRNVLNDGTRHIKDIKHIKEKSKEKMKRSVTYSMTGPDTNPEPRINTRRAAPLLTCNCAAVEAAVDIVEVGAAAVVIVPGDVGAERAAVDVLVAVAAAAAAVAALVLVAAPVNGST